MQPGTALLSAAFDLLLARPRRRARRDAERPRARSPRAHISQELRCLVCQNQSIDDFNAPLAHDLRVLVRERLVCRRQRRQVLAFVEARYGEFVLLRPRLKPQTLLLWLTPLLLLGGAAVFLVRARSREPAAA